MLAELTQIGAGWPLAVSLAAAVAVQILLAGRRRMALNEALHELRRPLQALVLALPQAERPEQPGADLPVQTALALERLDREINGDTGANRRTSVRVVELLEAAAARWSPRARAEGGDLCLRASVGRALVEVDRPEISRALDNLIINAIEHGGARVTVAAALGDGVLRVAVSDLGRGCSGSRRTPGWRPSLAALTGRRRHGHGLRVVKRAAAAHRGAFRLSRLGAGTEAIFELPLLDRAGER